MNGTTAETGSTARPGGCADCADCQGCGASARSVTAWRIAGVVLGAVLAGAFLFGVVRMTRPAGHDDEARTDSQ